MRPSQLKKNQSITIENQDIKFRFEFDHDQLWMVVIPPNTKNDVDESICQIPLLMVTPIDADQFFEDLESHAYSLATQVTE
jgi:hypothetical protein